MREGALYTAEHSYQHQPRELGRPHRLCEYWKQYIPAAYRHDGRQGAHGIRRRFRRRCRRRVARRCGRWGSCRCCRRRDRRFVGAAVGVAVGPAVGAAVGATVGACVGVVVGDDVGASVGNIGECVAPGGIAVGACVGNPTSTTDIDLATLLATKA